jgi:xylan 1,4-beta-xylosidase
MSQWVFSNTYEELGVSPYVLREGDNSFGMMAVGGIPKPQFNTYKLLHRLGNTRLVTSDGPVLASRRNDGSVAIAVWNLAEVPQASGMPGASWDRKVIGDQKQIQVVLKGARPGQTVEVSHVDHFHGSPYPEWRKLGSPQYPTLAQMELIRKSAELAPPETRKLGKNGELVLDLPPESLALIEVEAK